MVSFIIVSYIKEHVPLCEIDHVHIVIFLFFFFWNLSSFVVYCSSCRIVLYKG